MDENEKSVVIDKTFTCPVCDKKIKAKAVTMTYYHYYITKKISYKFQVE